MQLPCQQIFYLHSLLFLFFYWRKSALVFKTHCCFRNASISFVILLVLAAQFLCVKTQDDMVFISTWFLTLNLLHVFSECLLSAWLKRYHLSGTIWWFRFLNIYSTLSLFTQTKTLLRTYISKLIAHFRHVLALHALKGASESLKFFSKIDF